MHEIYIVVGRENHPDKEFQIHQTYFTSEGEAKEQASILNARDYNHTYKRQLWRWTVETLYSE